MVVEDSARIKAELNELDELEDLEKSGTQLRLLYASKPAAV